MTNKEKRKREKGRRKKKQVGSKEQPEMRPENVASGSVWAEVAKVLRLLASQCDSA
jgi:hypothetical protein